MAATPVTPVAGLTTTIETGGDAVIAVPAGPNGGYITNPASAEDQDIPDAEFLYVDQAKEAIIGAFGTTIGLAPGQSYDLIAGATNPVTVNASTAGHRFTVVYF
jgi:hypothetical protein